MSACPSEMQLHLMVQNTKYDYIPRPWNSASIAINWPIVPSIIPARGLSRRKRPPPAPGAGATLFCCTSPTRLSVQADATSSSTY